MNSKNNNNNNNIIHLDYSDKENKNIINLKNILQKKKNLNINSNNNLIEWGYKEIMKRKLKLKNKYNNNNNNKYKFSEFTNISQRNKKSLKLTNKNKNNRSNSNDSFYKKYKKTNSISPNNENSKIIYHYKSPNFLFKKKLLNNKNLLINSSFVINNSSLFLNNSNEINKSKNKNKKEKFLKIVNTSNFPKITEIQNYNIKLLNKNNSKKNSKNNFNKTNSTHNFFKKYQNNNLNLYKNLLFSHKNLNSCDNLDESNEKYKEKFKYKIGEILLNKYEIISKIGEGTFGLCLKCFDLIEKEFVCIKIIKKNSQNEKNNKEIEILKLLKNNKNINLVNIIKLKNNFIYKNYYFLVFELLYNNLYTELKINNFKGYNLNIIKKITIQILFCLLFLKKNNIIHCDIKPENILFTNKNKNDIKLIDFGSSCFNNKKQKYFYIQSRFYRAPEILLSKEYDFSIDMWSLGCILCELFIGYPIFPGENEDDMRKIIKNFSEKKGIFYDIFNDKNVDKDFIDFLKQCLTINFKNRIKPEDALKHKWIIKNINLNELQCHYDKINKIIE